MSEQQGYIYKTLSNCISYIYSVLQNIYVIYIKVIKCNKSEVVLQVTLKVFF